ncbi:hypothetical protein BT69DRAFT_1247661 [Atractiella rhizophila]|nr:hypothetical protein BT69DRAFT_1247661 [Atractiella rhizophila]
MIAALLALLPATFSQSSLPQTLNPNANAAIQSQAARPFTVSTPPLSPLHLDILSSLSFNSPFAIPPSSEPPIHSLSPLVLVHTLDGGFHALERNSGRWVWSLNSEADDVEMAGLKQPVVGGRNWRSFSNSSSVGKTKDVAVFQPPNAPESHNDTAPRMDIEVRDAEEYILEPYGDGDIYLRSAGTLQRLPVPLKTIIQLTPFTFPEMRSRMFVGRKESRILRVDMASGRVLGSYGGSGGQCLWHMEGSAGFERDCVSNILYVGYTEYSLQIVSKISGLTLQTLSYKTFHPASLTPAPWVTLAPDNLTLQPLPNGDLICVDTVAGDWKWHNSLSSPVIDIFELSSSEGEGEEPGETMMYRQKTVEFSLVGKGLGKSGKGLAWIGGSERAEGEGGRWIMSSEHYPLVVFAQKEEGEEGELAKVDYLVDEEPEVQVAESEESRVLGIEGPKEVVVVQEEEKDVIGVGGGAGGERRESRTKGWVAVLISQAALALLLLAGWFILGRQKALLSPLPPTKAQESINVQSQEFKILAESVEAARFPAVMASPIPTSPKPLPPTPPRSRSPSTTPLPFTSKSPIPPTPPATPSPTIPHPKVTFLEPSPTDISESDTNDPEAEQETEGGEGEGTRGRRRGRRRSAAQPH